MNYLLTGASGFLGQTLFSVLSERGSVTTMGLSKNDDIKCNLASGEPPLNQKHDIVVHAAGKAHVLPRNEAEIQDFYNVNLKGTINLCLKLETILPKKVIFISTVAVYGLESGELIDELFPLKGDSPYAQSKIQAEEFLLDWGVKNNVDITILRLPLLVGKNPPGNLGAMIKAIRNGYYFRFGNGHTRRSMVLAEDVAKLIASDEIKPGVYNLTDGYHPSFQEIEDIIAKQANKNIKSMPNWVIQTACRAGDYLNFLPINSYKYQKMISSLTFSDQNARKELNWNPRKVIDSFEI